MRYQAKEIGPGPLGWGLHDGERIVLSMLDEGEARQYEERLNGRCPRCQYPDTLYYDRGQAATYWEPGEPAGICCDECGDFVEDDFLPDAA